MNADEEERVEFIVLEIREGDSEDRGGLRKMWFALLCFAQGFGVGERDREIEQRRRRR